MNKEYVKVKNKKLLESMNDALQQCIDCNICNENCEMLQFFKTNPKKLFKSILKEEKVKTIIPYSCTMCGKCKKVCPKDIDTSRIFFNLRKDIVNQNKGKSPLKGHKSIHMHQKFSYTSFFTKYKNDINCNDKVEKLFFPGCSLCSYNPELVVKTYEYLKTKIPNLGILLQCCGKPTKDLGEEERFEKLSKTTYKDIKKTGTKEVIVACQNCYKTINGYSINDDFKVKSLWNVLKEIGIPKEAIGIGNENESIFTIHDSCPTRYESDIQDSIRFIVDKLGYKLVEKTNSRENTVCCGTGGMVHTVNPKLSKNIMENIVESCPSKYVITYCAGCRESMIRGGAKGFHILDLIFGGKIKEDELKFNVNTPLKSWSNRLKTKSLLK
ncbi:(Fe-S)-binding protein [Clostridium oceanicum]|uniref:(Fe-S)-binding protein n=1 Tax=Clostridium oceanicum TaxID=1543 RepID=A0ABP3V0G0_9CLOT